MERLIRPQQMTAGITDQLISCLCARYRFFHAVPIGRSVLGRPIRGIVFGGGKETVLMTAAFHGQEWMTAFICLRLCEEIGESIHNGTPLNGWNLRRAFGGRGVIWVPLVNPDGVEIALRGSATAQQYAEAVHAAGGDEWGRWQANARGVDLNHNFNAGFAKLQQSERENGITGFSARQWGGPYPHSEPETMALVRLCERQPFRHVVALHSQGEEIYWHYGNRTPSVSRLMASVMAAASGYTVGQPTGLASHGGFKDWFIEKTGKPGFTIELGKGENPLPIEEFETVYEKAREMLIVSLLI